jgi:hypothetical protein
VFAEVFIVSSKVHSMNSYPEYWPMMEESSFGFPDVLRVIKSERGRYLSQCIKRMDTSCQVFLRGSLLEKEYPFERADADLFVLYDRLDEARHFRGSLPAGFFYDVKFIQREKLREDFVYHALLQCRSLQIAGEELVRVPIRADKLFVWKHWLKYSLSTLPPTISSDDRWALINFKLLVRSFGVISLLKRNQFTRDIDVCIQFATSESAEIGEVLTEIRIDLENDKAFEVPIAKMKAKCRTLFDQNFDHIMD